MKENICTIIGVIGAFFTALVGGWDSALVTLITFMSVDFITGFVTAATGKSKHSVTGKLNSKAGWVGLAKKFCILLMVVVAMRIDILLGTTYIRDATCIGFCVNELLSIIENTSLMGIPYPDVLKKAIEVLQKKAGRTDETAQQNLEELEEKEILQNPEEEESEEDGS
ncbi:MAG: phage holin family protein [Oscillospiraceae bacterium]|nr:phage holin family protein [Oscillospiraceae bacterium]